MTTLSDQSPPPCVLSASFCVPGTVSCPVTAHLCPDGRSQPHFAPPTMWGTTLLATASQPLCLDTQAPVCASRAQLFPASPAGKTEWGFDYRASWSSSSILKRVHWRVVCIGNSFNKYSTGSIIQFSIKTLTLTQQGFNRSLKPENLKHLL
jgi:hypothetical protein